MELHVIDTGFFKLDGGAMFGVVPKLLWSRQYPADENNLCNWAARCLLVESGNKLILIDTGLGDKQTEKFFSYYYRNGEASLHSSIRKAGFDVGEVTDVVLTHLHFDHVGGAVERGGTSSGFALTFPNANYWTSEGQWDWAMNPNAREKASFLKENLVPLQESGRLRFVPESESPFSEIDFLRVDGHTEKMLLPVIQKGGQTFLYAADLVPSSAHLPTAWVMGYDVRPLVAMEEKVRILTEAEQKGYILIFEHDAFVEAATLQKTEKGLSVREKGLLGEFL